MALPRNEKNPRRQSLFISVPRQSLGTRNRTYALPLHIAVYPELRRRVGRGNPLIMGAIATVISQRELDDPIKPFRGA